MSYILEICSSFAIRKEVGGQAELSLSSAVTELTQCDEFHFNNTPFIFRHVILLLLFILSADRMQGKGKGVKYYTAKIEKWR
jgi:hypothetical protein